MTAIFHFELLKLSKKGQPVKLDGKGFPSRLKIYRPNGQGIEMAKRKENLEPLKKLEKRLYVRIGNEGDRGDDYYNTSKEPNLIAEFEKTVQVGVYELIEVVNVINKSVVEKFK